MTGREFIALRNETSDLVAFDLVLVNGAYEDFAAQIGALQREVAAAPASLGMPSVEVDLPASGVPYGDEAILGPGDGGELVFGIDDGMTLAVVCTRYGAAQATVRDIGVVGPLTPDA